jgi:hypothetical protein
LYDLRSTAAWLSIRRNEGGGCSSEARLAAKGAVVGISADGKIDPKPIAIGLVGPAGIAVAPSIFGKYAGQIFVTDAGDLQVPVPEAQPLKRDGQNLPHRSGRKMGLANEIFRDVYERPASFMPNENNLQRRLFGAYEEEVKRVVPKDHGNRRRY